MELDIHGHAIRIHCGDAQARAVLAGNFAAFESASTPPSSRVLEYTVTPTADRRYTVQTPAGSPTPAADLGEVVFVVEQSLVVELQRGNPELLFLHAAALEWEGRAILLVADSGGGKSTTAWALLQHGFGYLSDELAPIDLDTLQVLGYPHALCLKRAPPSPYGLPAATMSLGRTMHVPTVEVRLATAWERGRPLAAVFHLAFKPDAAPTLRPMRPAAAAARLYVNALNALAHPAHGLDAVKRVAEQVPNYAANTGDLAKTCALIVAAVKG